MVKNKNKILICKQAGANDINTPCFFSWLSTNLKAFPSFLQDHALLSTQGWCMMQDNSMMHPTSVTDTHARILPRPRAASTPGSQAACPTQWLVWMDIY